MFAIEVRGKRRFHFMAGDVAVPAGGDDVAVFGAAITAGDHVLGRALEVAAVFEAKAVPLGEGSGILRPHRHAAVVAAVLLAAGRDFAESTELVVVGHGEKF